jgi:hypothetical protein
MMPGSGERRANQREDDQAAKYGLCVVEREKGVIPINIAPELGGQREAGE